MHSTAVDRPAQTATLAEALQRQRRAHRAHRLRLVLAALEARAAAHGPGEIPAGLAESIADFSARLADEERGLRD